MRWREAPWRSQIRARWRDAGEEPSWGEARRRRGERAEWRGGMRRRGGERRGLVRPFLPAFLLSFVPLFNLSVTPPPSHRTPVPELRALVNGDEWPHTATVEPLRSAENVDSPGELGLQHHALPLPIFQRSRTCHQRTRVPVGDLIIISVHRFLPSLVFVIAIVSQFPGLEGFFKSLSSTVCSLWK